MSYRFAVALLLVLIAAPLRADEPSKAEVEHLKRLQEVEKNLSRRLANTVPAPAAAELMQDITVLQTLYSFRLTPGQRTALRSLARETAPKPRAAKEVKASAELRKTLVDLRAALLKEDEDRVEKLGDKLDELRKAENVDVEDVEITDAARRRAPEALRLLSAKQVADYLAANADDIPDPVGLLLDAMGKVRGLPEDEWKQLRDDLSDRVALLVAGLDDERVDEVSERVAALLIEARNFKEDEFKTRKAELEKAARKLLGDLGPTDIIRNVLERTLAETLSNSRLPAVLDAYPK